MRSAYNLLLFLSSRPARKLITIISVCLLALAALLLPGGTSAAFNWQLLRSSLTRLLPLTPPATKEAVTAKTAARRAPVATAAGAVPMFAPLTWQVQSDYRGTRDSVSQPRSLRGLALTSDDSSIYGGFIQGSSSAVVRKVSSAIIANPITVGSVDIQAVTGAINQAKGVATDDRGNVYVTLNPFGASTSLQFRIYSSNLATTISTTTSTDASSQLAGLSVQKIGAKYYLYLSRNGGLATVERWDVTNTAAPTLDTAWGTSGKIDLKTLSGSANAYCNGLEVDTDGTLYISGGILSTTRGDSVFKVSPDGTTLLGRVDVSGAMDVAIFAGKVYTTQYLSSTSSIDVRNTSDLSFIETLTTGISHPYTGSPANSDLDNGYSGIDISADGRIFVADQVYDVQSPNRTNYDRILVSSRIDPDAPIVTINQAAGQVDPTNSSPINFTVTFSEPVIGFATGDVTLSGTAGATTATVTGGPTTYNVAVSGMTSSGTVIATIGANVATDLATNNNLASTSTDNTVMYTFVCPAFTISPGTLARGKRGIPYSPVVFSAAGGFGSYTYSQGGALPLGMTFSGNTLSGTPNQAGTFSFTISAKDSLGCITPKSYLLVVDGFSSSISDPIVCTGDSNTLNVHAELVNPNANAVGFSFNAPIVPPLSGVPGTCVSSFGTCTITTTSVSVTGTLPIGQTLTVDYKVQVANGTPQGTNLCITSTGQLDIDNNGAFDTNDSVQACAPLNCPLPVANVAVSDQKAGSILVFPYYTSNTAQQKDTRLTINNVGTQQTIVHVFFIDGVSCQQSDQFVCLTPNASFSFKTSEYDPETTGWLLAVAVDAKGIPIQNNALIGNAFVKDGDTVDDYGAESFAANSRSVASIANGLATLYFDGGSYDAVPNQFSVGIQSPVDAPNQRIVTASLSGNLVTGQLNGATQVGTGLIFNEKETPFSSFTAWLTGTCQAQALITNSSPRVSNGMSTLIKTGQTGVLKFNVGAAVGVIITPRPAVWRGIRTLHKTGRTTSTLIIPIIQPVC